MYSPSPALFPLFFIMYCVVFLLFLCWFKHFHASIHFTIHKKIVFSFLELFTSICTVSTRGKRFFFLYGRALMELAWIDLHLSRLLYAITNPSLHYSFWQKKAVHFRSSSCNMHNPNFYILNYNNQLFLHKKINIAF